MFLNVFKFLNASTPTLWLSTLETKPVTRLNIILFMGMFSLSFMRPCLWRVLRVMVVLLLWNLISTGVVWNVGWYMVFPAAQFFHFFLEASPIFLFHFGKLVSYGQLIFSYWFFLSLRNILFFHDTRHSNIHFCYRS